MDKILTIVQMLVRLFIPDVTSAKGSIYVVKDTLKILFSSTASAAAFVWVYQEILSYYGSGGDQAKALIGMLVVGVLKAVIEALRQWADGPDQPAPPAPPSS